MRESLESLAHGEVGWEVGFLESLAHGEVGWEVGFAKRSLVLEPFARGEVGESESFARGEIDPDWEIDSGFGKIDSLGID